MSDEPFLSRWSRRKQAASKMEPAAPPPSGETAEAAEAAETPLPPDLPPVDSLGKESDYSAFLRDGVPKELKQAALKKLWESDPALMAPEIMDLHMGDYAAPTLDAVATAWRLGRGVLDAAERAAEAEDGAQGTPPPTPSPAAKS